MSKFEVELFDLKTNLENKSWDKFKNNRQIIGKFWTKKYSFLVRKGKFKTKGGKFYTLNSLFDHNLTKLS